MRAMSADAVSDAPGRRAGRPRDRSRDGTVLTTTLESLADRAYEDVTLDDLATAVGVAKTTLYRRWSSKEELVLAAVEAAGSPPETRDPPDTGSLRGDLIAVIDSDWLGGPERRLRILAGLARAARVSPRLAETIRHGVTEPYVAVHAGLIARAAARGELAPNVEERIPLLAQVLPAMSSHRLELGGPPVDRAWYVAVVDEVLLPALRG